MYGKIFESMFSGSMVGAGAPVFAVMSFVVAHQKPHEDYYQVEINPVLLAVILGEPPETIRAAIDFLCAPDKNSRSEADEGRRLVKVGSFDYRVVNGKKYAEIRKDAERREQNRTAQQRHRAKKTMAGWVKSQESADDKAAARHLRDNPED